MNARKVRAGVGSAVVALAMIGTTIACDDLHADPITQSFSPLAPDASLTSTRIPLVACPRSVAENGPCGSVGNVCETGTSPDPECNTVFVCAQEAPYGKYFTEQTHGRCAGTCPDPSTIVEGAPCEVSDAGATDDEILCETPLGTCGCTTGRDGAHAHARVWVCTKPAEGCPDERPLLGQPCVGEHACDYGSCAFKHGWRMICADDVWQTEAGRCAD